MAQTSIRDLPLSEVYFARPDLPTSFERAVLPIDKPKGWTSFDVIRKLRRLLGVRKVGHAGTLDPMATGLLIVLVGQATKLMQRFMQLPKEYTGTLRLGETTPTYDAESDVVERRDISHLSDADLDTARRSFLGTIRQQTPSYSAVRVGGERLYRKARRGEEVNPPFREVEISHFELTSREGPDVSFVVRCSKGTYIRSLAHEFGQVLGVGAHLVALRRTAIGDYSVDDAWTIDQLREALV